MHRRSVVLATTMLFSSEGTSWADEFRRILKLFEDNLRLKAGKVTN